MSTATTRRRQFPCLSDSSNFHSSTSLAQLAAEHHRTARHGRTASVPVAGAQYRGGHQRSRSWLTSFMKAAPQPPPKVEEPEERATRRRRTDTLGASLRRKMKNLGVSPAELENLPPPRPAPPTLLPDKDMAALRQPRATPHPRHLSLPYGTLAKAQQSRNASWDWDGGEGNREATVKGHARRGYKTMSLDGGVSAGARAAKMRDGRVADLGSIWETFTEEFDEGEVISFDLPPASPTNGRKGSVAGRRVPVPTFIPFPSNLSPTEQLFDPLDTSAHLNRSTATSHLDLDGFPSPPLGGDAQQFDDEQERLASGDEEESYVWNSAILPSRHSSLASRRDRVLPAPLIIEAEPPSAFDEPTPSPTDSHSIYSVEDDVVQQQRRVSYFSPITPTFPIDASAAYSPTTLQPPSSITFNRGGHSDVLVSPRSSMANLQPAPRRSPILEGLAISSSGLIPSTGLTPPKHQRHASASSPLALRTLKALPLLPPPSDEGELAQSTNTPLANSLPFSHASFLSPFSTEHSPPRKAPSPHPSPRSQSRPSPPRIPLPSSKTSQNLSASLGSSVGLSSEIDRQEDWAREESRRGINVAGEATPYNPSPQLPSSSIFTATTRFEDDFSPYQQSMSSFETKASSVHSADAGRRVKDYDERPSWSVEDNDEEDEDADSSRMRGERWIQREMSGDWGGSDDREGEDDDDELEDGEGEETMKLEIYTRRELQRREEERRVRYAKERASLYAEPGPDEAVYVYGVAL